MSREQFYLVRTLSVWESLGVVSSTGPVLSSWVARSYKTSAPAHLFLEVLVPPNNGSLRYLQQLVVDKAFVHDLKTL